MNSPLIWRCTGCGHITPRHPDTPATDMTECVHRYDYGCQGHYEADILMEQDKKRLEANLPHRLRQGEPA